MARRDQLDSVSDTVARIIRLSSSRSAFAQQAAIAGVSLSQPGYALLRVLIDEGAVPMGELARRAHMDLGLATRQVGALVDAGLASRRSDPDDRRVTLIETTVAGARTAAALRELRRQHLETALRGWSDTDVAAFDRSLQRFVEDTTATSFEGL
jgi:DNA-binding MarR family transcriptional regulator